MPSLALVSNSRSGERPDRHDLAARLRLLGAEVTSWRLEDREQALASHPDRIVVAGGDGSIACVAEVARKGGVPLAVLPLGTANDFARAMGLPRDLDAALEVAVAGKDVRRLELGYMESRAFVNVASAGLAPMAARHAAPLKPRLGVGAYVVGALVAGLRAPPLPCRVSVDGREVFSGSAWQVTIASSGAFGGGSSLDVANPRDGLLDAAVIESGARIRLLRHAYGLRLGHIAEQPGVHHARGDEVEVEVPDETPWNVDGEMLLHGRARFRAERDGFEMVRG